MNNKPLTSHVKMKAYLMPPTPRVFRITWDGHELDVHAAVYPGRPPEPNTISIQKIFPRGKLNGSGEDRKYDLVAIEELCHDELESEHG